MTYIYAMLDSNTGIVLDFMTDSYLWTEEEDPYSILVDEIDRTWIQRKRYDFDTHTFVDVLPSETPIAHNSLEYVHTDSNGTKHWLDNFVNDIAADVAAIEPVDTSNFATANHTHSNYAASNHNHNNNYVSKDLQFTDNNGSFKYSYVRDDNKNVLDEFASYPIGFYTVYSQSGTSGNPKTTEAWRFMVHKTGTNTGWVQGYGSLGSVYTNYIDGSSGWRGWRCVWDNDPNPLWSGQMYMSSSNSTPQVVTPTKKLSECRTGWLLLWSDYDPGASANDADFVTTMIPKNNPSGGTWGGKSFLCDIPRYVGSNAEDVDTERRIIKPIYIHDDRIEGSYQNAYDERNDVVLRAVYEF